MKYQIPEETLPNSYSKYAVNSAVPFLIGILAGFLPAVIWSLFNSFFLGCRDFKYQVKVIVPSYIFVAGIAVWLKFLRNTGFFKDIFGVDELLVYFLARNFVVLGFFSMILWMQLRQSGIAEYRKEMGYPLDWGIPVAVLILLSTFCVIDPLTKKIPYLYQVWGM